MVEVVQRVVRHEQQVLAHSEQREEPEELEL
jgi:hypothetical protein